MAEPINYSGVTYNPDYYRGNESFADYMQRLAANRAGGVLGGGGMFDTPAVAATEEITSTPLGQEVQNCPAGYVLRNGACVPASQGGSDEPENRRVSKEERYNGMRTLLDNPMLAAGVRAVMPLNLGNIFLRDSQIEGYVRNEQNEATKSQGFLDYLMGKDGDYVLSNTGTNSLATGKASGIPTYNSTSGNSFMEDYNSGMFNTFDPRSAADARTARQAGMLPQLPSLPNQIQQSINAEMNRNQAAALGGAGGNYAFSFSNASYSSGGWNPNDGGGFISNSADGNDWDSFNDSSNNSSVSNFASNANSGA